MFNWFKRKNAQADVDKKSGTTKINAGDVAVEVDGKKITVAELEEAMILKEAEEAEDAKKKELEAQNAEMEPISMQDTFTATNGKEYKVGDLVENWKKRQAKKNASGDDKNKADDEAKAAEEKKNALIERAKGLGLNENATEEEITKAETEKKNAADAEAKEKADKEAKEKEESDKKENAKKLGKAFFKDLHNARESGETPAAPVASRGRSERAKAWAKKNGRK